LSQQASEQSGLSFGHFRRPVGVFRGRARSRLASPQFDCARWPENMPRTPCFEGGIPRAGQYRGLSPICSGQSSLDGPPNLCGLLPRGRSRRSWVRAPRRAHSNRLLQDSLYHM